jgi:hypothetical protein
MAPIVRVEDATVAAGIGRAEVRALDVLQATADLLELRRWPLPFFFTMRPTTSDPNGLLAAFWYTLKQ